MKPFTLERLQALRVAAVRAVLGGVVRSSQTERTAAGPLTVIATRAVVGRPGRQKDRPRVRYLLNGRPVRRAALETQAAAGYL